MAALDLLTEPAPGIRVERLGAPVVLGEPACRIASAGSVSVARAGRAYRPGGFHMGSSLPMPPARPQLSTPPMRQSRSASPQVYFRP